MRVKNYFFLLVLVLFSFAVNAQETYGPTETGMLQGPIYVPSIAEQISNGTVVLADNTPMNGHPKRRRGNNVVPGKGSSGNDPLVELQRGIMQQRNAPPILVWDADISQATPSDPTGAAGPNHYVTAWNSAFRIWDKNGNPLTSELSLGTIFPGNTIGDPIVFYDAQADRIVITEFDSNPNGFNVAVCQGSDPVNDGWHVYTSGFGTGSFPDYTKFAVFADTYMVTANIGSSNRVFAVERNEMLNGDPAQFVALPLPGISTSGFYSPHAFHTTDDVLAPAGTPVPIVYLQDDAWGGVSDDHLKIWSATIDWVDTGNSSISAAQEITTADFISVFDGGFFDNLEQPSGPDIDALQAIMMNQVQYRRFPDYNSAVMTFVVDTDGSSSELAGIRWYELRQTSDGQPWTIYQEGTYTSPVNGKHAFSGSIAMNGNGDIAMSYTTVSNTENIAIYYTGRMAGDPLNIMTVAEDLIAQSTTNSPTTRVADYTHLTVDPADDLTFWNISEYFAPTRRDVAAHIQLTPPLTDDIGVLSIDAPVDGPLTSNEDIVITIRNFGSNDITDPEVQYDIDGGLPVVENYSGTILAGSSETYTFATQADLSAPGSYIINSRTNLGGDSNTANDETSKTVTNGAIYCQPSMDCSFGHGFTNVTINEIDNDSGCEGYADFTNLAANMDEDTTYQITVTTGYGDQNVQVWIDFNDDGVFENSEIVVPNFIIAPGQAAGSYTESADLVVPAGAANGQHRMRFKSNWQAPVPSDACEETQYGETEDYTANVDGVLGIDDITITNGELIVISKDNDQYEIILVTDFDGIASIAIYNVLGQPLAFNNLVKEGNAYNYQLDMSYAAPGVYFIKIGDQVSNTYQSAKIIVR